MEIVHRNSYVVFTVPLNVAVAELAEEKLPPAPLTTVHSPVPVVGAFPERFTLSAQKVASSPAAAVVGGATNSIVTSSSEAGQSGPAEIVQRSVYVLPAIPVKVLLAAPASPNDPPDPDTTLQVPIPEEGTLPASVVELPHNSTSKPAEAVDGAELKTIVRSSSEGVHAPFVVVHRNVYVVPVTPVNGEVGLAGSPNTPPEPETTDHAPLPTEGVFAASVT